MTPHPALKVWLRGEGNANDASRYANHATLTDGAVATATGKFGRCFELASADPPQQVLVPVNAHTTVADSSAATILAWVRLTATPANFAHVYIENTTSDAAARLGLSLTTSRAPRLGWRIPDNEPSGTQSNMTGSAVLALNTWHHLAAVWSTTFRAIYVDGVLDASESTTIPAFGTATSSAIRMGTSGPTATVNQFVGHIDEWMIFNSRALTIEDIRLIMTLQTPQRIAP